jgi:hypothetical protein
MLLADRSEGLSGLRQWSEPVIFDRLIVAYYKLIEDRELARGLTRLHARVWRALIADDMEGFEELRETLVGASSLAISRSIIWRRSTARS